MLSRKRKWRWPEVKPSWWELDMAKLSTKPAGTCRNVAVRKWSDRTRLSFNWLPYHSAVIGVRGTQWIAKDYWEKYISIPTWTPFVMHFTAALPYQQWSSVTKKKEKPREKTLKSIKIFWKDMVNRNWFKDICHNCHIYSQRHKYWHPFIIATCEVVVSYLKVIIDIKYF